MTDSSPTTTSPTTTSTPSPPSSNDSGRSRVPWIVRKIISGWSRSGNTKEFTWREIFAALAVLGAVGGLVVALIQSVADTNVRQDRESAEQRIYSAELQTYNDATEARNLCLNSVDASLRNRDMWERTVTLLHGANLDDAADYLSAGALLNTPPRTRDECGDPPVMPDPPSTG